jgi:hypothetical protein
MLGKVASKTNGVLRIVNPLELNDHVKNVLDNKLIASDVRVKLIVNHKYLYIRDECLETAEAKALVSSDPISSQEIEKLKKSISEKYVGIVNENSQLFFQFGIRKAKNNKIKNKRLGELPFQIQISYTDSKGSKKMLVYTQKLKFCSDRKKVESQVSHTSLVYMHASQKISYHMLHSDVSAAKLKTRQVKKLQMINQWLAPNVYKDQTNVVEQFDTSKSTLDLNDKEVESIYGEKFIHL